MMRVFKDIFTTIPVELQLIIFRYSLSKHNFLTLQELFQVIRFQSPLPDFSISIYGPIASVKLTWPEYFGCTILTNVLTRHIEDNWDYITTNLKFVRIYFISIPTLIHDVRKFTDTVIDDYDKISEVNLDLRSTDASIINEGWFSKVNVIHIFGISQFKTVLRLVNPMTAENLRTLHISEVDISALKIDELVKHCDKIIIDFLEFNLLIGDLLVHSSVEVIINDLTFSEIEEFKEELLCRVSVSNTLAITGDEVNPINTVTKFKKVYGMKLSDTSIHSFGSIPYVKSTKLRHLKLVELGVNNTLFDNYNLAQFSRLKELKIESALVTERTFRIVPNTVRKLNIKGDPEKSQVNFYYRLPPKVTDLSTTSSIFQQLEITADSKLRVLELFMVDTFDEDWNPDLFNRNQLPVTIKDVTINPSASSTSKLNLSISELIKEINISLLPIDSIVIFNERHLIVQGSVRSQLQYCSSRLSDNRDNSSAMNRDLEMNGHKFQSIPEYVISIQLSKSTNLKINKNERTFRPRKYRTLTVIGSQGLICNSISLGANKKFKRNGWKIWPDLNREKMVELFGNDVCIVSASGFVTGYEENNFDYSWLHYKRTVKKIAGGGGLVG